ncbi:Hypothetical protein R9X50_00524900 [Acrodontium crateriforme]|uniref:NTF2-like domain-containing protein n=1 Tax=Acrodontium crateriforme TaxID=150365 RepID=A0AAQ3RAQ8_9PEZI|nr:Hypothetical protein R9X50_00524900 [Acrodontium crateriforme]
MKTTSILAAAFAFASAGHALPQPTSSTTISWWPWSQCISQSAAEQFVQRFSGILSGKGSDLGDKVATANALVADSFQEVSDSINSLAMKPLGSVTEPSKQSYVAGITHAPTESGIETINVFVTDCNKILWHWNFKGVGSGVQEVKGFNLFTMAPNLNNLQVTRLDLEFNSIAWGADTGFTTTPPSGSAPS